MGLQKLFPQSVGKNNYGFRIWAPETKTVKLVDVAGGKEFPMEQQDNGYWYLENSDIKPGFRYKYRVKNGTFPDPASLSQPDGVHGASELVSLSDYKWSDKDWKGIPLEEMIIYELHPGTFSSSNDFRGIIHRLDHLVELGINTIEIMPVAQFSGERNWGYDGAYPFAVQSTYGGAEGLQELVDACHNKGIAVLLDVVYNHLGPEGNYLANYGPYFSDHYSTPWGSPLNFDGPHSDEVRNYFFQNALMWCRDFHIDGLRLDAVHAIYDFGAKHFLKELKEHLSDLGEDHNRNYILIAESNLNDIRYIDTPGKGGFGLDAQWSDDFHHAFHTLVTGEKAGYYMDYGSSNHLVKALDQAFIYDGKYSPFRKKTYGSDPQEISAEKFVVFNQNHDQTGNRKNGERLIELTDFDTAKVAAGTLLIGPYVPMLFMGEEYAERNPFLYFVSHEDDELNRLVKKGRREEFKDFNDDKSDAPDPADKKTFEKSVLSWGIGRSNEKTAMFNFYKRMIELRKKHPALQKADKGQTRVSEQEGVILLERWEEESRVIVIINPVDKPGSVSLPIEMEGDFHKIIDTSDEQWLGFDGASPKKVTAGDQISAPVNSMIIYSNKEM